MGEKERILSTCKRLLPVKKIWKSSQVRGRMANVRKKVKLLFKQ